MTKDWILINNTMKNKNLDYLFHKRIVKTNKKIKYHEYS